MTSPSSSTHQCLVQLFPICPVQFPFRNASSPSTLPGLTYPLTLNHGLTKASLIVAHGPISRTLLEGSLLTDISDGFSIPPLMIENNTVISSDNITVDENIDPNDMVFIIDEVMEPGEIVDLDQAMNPLQIDPTLNNWLVMFPKDVPTPTRIQKHQTISYRDNHMHHLISYENVPDLLIRPEVLLVWVDVVNPLDISSRFTQVIQIPTLYQGDLLLQVIVEEGPVRYILEQDVIFKEELIYWNEPIASFYEGLGYAFPMEKYHSTPAHPVHNQGFKIVQCDHHAFSKYFIEFYELLKLN
ncbi:hypothetical protein HD554DRAFT_2174775 [Boletus coccyginus]|nr:hypothetical protein HD554DRAFT_2174775 [Boletus coccyginus]